MPRIHIRHFHIRHFYIRHFCIRHLSHIAAGIDALNEGIGRLLAWLTLAMVLLTFLVVVLRYGFDLGWIAMQETVTYLHALVFMGAAAYTLKRDGHVRVDIFYSKFSTRGQTWVDLGGTLFLLIPICLLILIGSFDYVATSWTRLEGSFETGGLPLVFVIKGFIPLFAGLLLLQAIARILHCLEVLLSKQGRCP